MANGPAAMAQGLRDGARRAEQIRAGEKNGWGDYADLAEGRRDPESDYEIGFLLGRDTPPSRVQ